MANQVYANDMEVSCKAADGKTICAFPDVCFTPPQTPATPPGVPIPYPNTGMASDCTDGASTVQISGQEVMLKNKSYFKRSTGDEAGCAPQKGVITASNMGKVYFIAWSMDVHAEGENVVRHLDMTTGNHACPTANEAVPWTYAQRMALGIGLAECKNEVKAVKKACGRKLNRQATCPPEGSELERVRSAAAGARKAGASTKVREAHRAEVKRAIQKLAGKVQKDDCQKALRCFLVPPNSGMCCPGQTPDHLIEVKSFVLPGEHRETGKKRPGWDRYKASEAPCMCVEGGAQSVSTHGVLSAKRKVAVSAFGKGKPMPLDTAGSIGAKSASTTFRGCSEACIKAQLMQYHNSVQDDPGATVRPPAHGMTGSTKAKSGVLARSERLMKG
jgi:hypothetical protein